MRSYLKKKIWYKKSRWTVLSTWRSVIGLMGKKGSPFCVKPIWVKTGKITFRNLTSPPLTKQSHYVFFKI